MKQNNITAALKFAAVCILAVPSIVLIGLGTILLAIATPVINKLISLLD